MVLEIRCQSLLEVIQKIWRLLLIYNLLLAHSFVFNVHMVVFLFIYGCVPVYIWLCSCLYMVVFLFIYGCVPVYIRLCSCLINVFLLLNVLLYVYAPTVYLCIYCMFIYSLYVYVSLRLT
jgi:hypothetical protein